MANSYIDVGTPAAAGQKAATYKVPGGGPAGEDVHFERDAVQPDNAVGRVLVSVPYQQLPTASYGEITGVDIAAELLFINNTTDLMQAVFVRTKAGTPLPLFTGSDTNKLPPGMHLFPLAGVEFLDGLEWKAGAPGVYGAFKGYKELP